jgi:hypothetical protein
LPLPYWPPLLISHNPSPTISSSRVILATIVACHRRGWLAKSWTGRWCSTCPVLAVRNEGTRYLLRFSAACLYGVGTAPTLACTAGKDYNR